MKARCSRSFLALALTALATVSISAQSAPPAPSRRGDGPAPAPKPLNITRSDPGLDAIAGADTKTELLATGFDNVMRLEKDGTTRTVLSSGSNGKRFSGPNDIVVAKDDAVYLTDNDFGLRDGGKNPDKQLPNGICRISTAKGST